MKLDHVGIVTASIEEGTKIWEGLLGLHPLEVTEVGSQKLKVATFDAGGVRVELLQPLGEGSPISKFLATRGGGLHHICFQVEDIAATLSGLREKGVMMIDESPRPGVTAKKIAFLHPRSMGGVLIELCEK